MYIVIETFDPQYPTIVNDWNGRPKLFETDKEALEEAVEVQRGIIVEI